jgi:hypothetical protein
MDYFTEMYGADAFDDPRNWVDGQFKPRKRIARDREAVRVPMQFMDAASTQCGGLKTWRASLRRTFATPLGMLTRKGARVCKTNGARTAARTSTGRRPRDHSGREHGHWPTRRKRRLRPMRRGAPNVQDWKTHGREKANEIR